MTFAEAHDLMDLLLDKADQPYFTTEEKDKFLNIALFNWFESACENFDNNQELAINLGHFIREEGQYFYGTGWINCHKKVLGPHRIPYHGWTDQFEVRGPSYPIAKILHLSVQHADADGLISDPERRISVRKAKSNEVTTVTGSNTAYYPNTGSDPFNKPTGDDPVYIVQGTTLRIFPYRNENGDLLQGMASSGYTGASDGVDWGNAGFWRMRYLTYPLGSNVDAGDFDIDETPWATADVQLGAQTPQRRWDTATAATIYSNDSVGVKDWGFPEHWCHEIVQNAVRLMTGNIESENYQIQAIESEQSKSV